MLEIVGEGNMRLQFLGIGGAFTDFHENYNNNAIIESSEGWVLIDCGVTAVQSMKELDVHPTEIQGLLLTTSMETMLYRNN